MAVYLTPIQMTIWYDSRKVLNYVTDTGVEGSLSDLTNTASAPYILVAALIEAVSAEVDSALQQGRRYSRVDLEALITAANDADPNDPASDYAAKQKRVALLRRMVADLTFTELLNRRGFSPEIIAANCPRYAEASNMLAALAAGSRVFDTDPPKDAGVPDRAPIGVHSTSLSVICRSPLFGFFGRAWDSPCGLFN